MYWNKIKLLFDSKILNLSYATIFYRMYVNHSAEIFSILKVVSDLYLPNKYKWRECNEVRFCFIMIAEINVFGIYISIYFNLI